MPRKTKDETLPQNEVELENKEKSIDDLTQESEVSLTVNDSKNKNMFLTKIGITFILYYFVCFCTSVFILIDTNHSSQAFRMFKLQAVVWVFLAVILLIRIAFATLGKFIRKLAKLVFIIDLFAAVMFILGIYYYLDSFRTSIYYTYSPFVVIIIINLFVSSFFFTLTTLYQSKSKQYNYIIGMCLMTIFNILAIIAIAFGWKQIVTVTIGQYIWIGVIMLVLNLYITVNSYYIVNVRGDKYMESDAVYAFYCYSTDWAFEFPRDLFRDTKRIIRHQRRKAKRNREARELRKMTAQDIKTPLEEKKNKEPKKTKPSKNNRNSSALKESEEPQNDKDLVDIRIA